MPEIAPFRGIRYNAGVVGNMLDVVAPPYDVISPEEQDAFYARHPNNCIRVILAKEQDGDSDASNRYTRAAAALREWLETGVLVEDETPAMYAYEQQFTWEGATYARRGILTALRVAPFGEGDVLPHEFTKPGAKADRLALMKATGANTSPIFGIFPDEAHDVAGAVEAVWDTEPAVDITDEQEVRHRLWVLTDADVLASVADLMRDRPVYIADGHHRYETTCTYAAWAEEQGETTGDLHRYCIMMLVAMSDPGLAVMPTHRLLTGLGDLAPGDLVGALADAFDVAEFEGKQCTPEAVERALLERAADHAFGLVAEGGTRAWLLTLKDEAVLDGRPGGASADWRRLDVAILADLIIEDTIRQRLGRDVEVGYDHKADTTWQAVANGACQMAFLLNATPVERVKTIAAGGERMPAKSTFFYPKLLSGLVFRRLK